MNTWTLESPNAIFADLFVFNFGIFISFRTLPLSFYRAINPLVSIEETGEHIPVAQGQIVLDEEYQASDKLVIPITELAFDGANDSENVNGVAIEFCDTGLGCTAEFWQQEQSIAFWPSSISPDDTFESVFQRSIFEKGPGNGQGNPNPLNQKGNIPDNTLGLGKPQPTLLDVLSYSGNAKNDFAANAVAALLNAETIENSFGYDPEEIILMSQQAIDEGEYEAARDLLAAKNELGCPFLETIGETKGE